MWHTGMPLEELVGARLIEVDWSELADGPRSDSVEGDRVYSSFPEDGLEVLADAEVGGLPITTVFLRSGGEPDVPARFTGPIPLGLDFEMARDRVQALLGPPQRSADPRGLFPAYDRWRLESGLVVHCEYTAGERSIRLITLMGDAPG